MHMFGNRTALSAALLFMGVATGLVHPEASLAQEVASYGAWSTVTEGGSATVMTRFRDGSVMAITDAGGGVRLVLEDPSWRLSGDETVPVAINIAGERFTANADVVGRDTISMNVANSDFLVDFMHAYSAVLYVRGEEWDVDLTGTYAMLMHAAYSE